MDQLTVSVVIPTYNRAHLIGRAVNSVLNQTKPGDEVIVVDDGSSDNTEEILRPYGDSIRYIGIANSGAGAARNKGIRMATKTLVAFLDSDDEWMPGKLNIQRQLMAARPDILFCFSDIAITTRKGGVIRNYLRFWHNDPRSWDQILGMGEDYREIVAVPEDDTNLRVHIGDLYPPLAKAAYVATSTMVSRRVEAGDDLRFEEGVPMYEDWFCFARLARRGRAAYLDIETAWQHSHPGPRLTDPNSLLMTETRLKVLERMWGKDSAYMAEHEADYRAVVREQHLLRASSLISLGRTGEARQALKSVTHAPVHFVLLAAFPGTLVRELLRLRRALRSILWRITGKPEPE